MEIILENFAKDGLSAFAIFVIVFVLAVWVPFVAGHAVYELFVKDRLRLKNQKKKDHSKNPLERIKHINCRCITKLKKEKDI